MAKSTQKKVAGIKHSDDLKLAVKRFVVLNIVALLKHTSDTDDIAKVVTELITAHTNEALDELVAALTPLAATAGKEVRHA